MNLSSVSGPGSPLVPPVPAPTPDGQTGTQSRGETAIFATRFAMALVKLKAAAKDTQGVVLGADEVAALFRGVCLLQRSRTAAGSDRHV